jgi:hypothetical protein
MSLQDCNINAPSPEELHHIFFDPPDPPTLPAERQRYHNGRRWKLESQGQANRRARRDYRSLMTWHYVNQYDAGAAMEAFEIEMLKAPPPSRSLYDFVMKQGTTT